MRWVFAQVVPIPAGPSLGDAAVRSSPGRVPRCQSRTCVVRNSGVVGLGFGRLFSNDKIHVCVSAVIAQQLFDQAIK